MIIVKDIKVYNVAMTNSWNDVYYADVNISSEIPSGYKIISAMCIISSGATPVDVRLPNTVENSLRFINNTSRTASSITVRVVFMAI